MKVIISSTGDRYGRCGIRFTREGAEFDLVDKDDDDRASTPPSIGRKTYGVLADEVKAGRLSILPASQAIALASKESASARISELESELEAAKARIAELEAAKADDKKKGAAK